MTSSLGVKLTQRIGERNVANIIFNLLPLGGAAIIIPAAIRDDLIVIDNIALIMLYITIITASFMLCTVNKEMYK